MDKQGIAAVDAVTGAVTGWAPSLSAGAPCNNPQVYSLAALGSTIYVGGCFDSIGTKRRHHVGAIDAISGEPTDWDPGADQRVFTIAAADSLIFAGGEFRTIGGKREQSVP